MRDLLCCGGGIVPPWQCSWCDQFVDLTAETVSFHSSSLFDNFIDNQKISVHHFGLIDGIGLCDSVING
jgi:hypothetical protein